MQVFPSFFGPIKRPSQKGPVQLPDRARVQDLLEALGYEPEHWKGILVLRSAQRLSLTDSLQDGDRIELTIRVGGG